MSPVKSFDVISFLRLIKRASFHSAFKNCSSELYECLSRHCLLLFNSLKFAISSPEVRENTKGHGVGQEKAKEAAERAKRSVNVIVGSCMGSQLGSYKEI